MAVTNEEEEHLVRPNGLKFACDTTINGQVKIWLGNICTINTDAIVNSTNESMTNTTGLSGQILEAAGPEIRTEIYRTEQCRTGEARMTSAGALPCKVIVHTVGPRYNEKYRTAAENALHGCYRSCLTTIKEQKMTSIAVPIINSVKRGYPPDTGAHIALRTVRRFLEHWGQGIECIVFCMSDLMEYNLYHKILPLYFPRNTREEIYSKQELPRDIGNEFGETVIEERKIKIAAFPGLAPGQSLPPPSASIHPHLTPKIKLNIVALSEFGMMKPDLDEEKKKRVSLRSRSEVEMIEQQHLYSKWLAKSREIDLSDIARLGMIYVSGKDPFGRPIVVIVGSKLPAKVSVGIMDKIFTYLIKIMDPIVNKEYVVVYLHTFMDDKDKPDWSWLQKAYNIMDTRYGNNLRTFYIVHPTFWLKLAESFVSTFMVNDSKFWMKVKYVEKLSDLFGVVSRDQVVIPEEILKWDYKEFGEITVGHNNDEL
eukprot:TRINITY_DN10139_c0_g1_i1.p1 TRINITY_DN10139_c0_g1~~TRINITY_DN10139_c0_g1_i1.p1  ORF type:complete len:510 (-),score=103.15 TRINITY_DN10139_c0_g1_i1:144-1589(-)